jgi:hypothetical protein
MRAKDCVPGGGSFHARAGERFLPVQAYFAGIDCPFMNASLVSVRDMLASIVEVDSETGDSGSGDGEAAGAQAVRIKIRL